MGAGALTGIGRRRSAAVAGTARRALSTKPLRIFFMIPPYVLFFVLALGACPEGESSRKQEAVCHHSATAEVIRKPVLAFIFFSRTRYEPGTSCAQIVRCKGAPPPL